MTFAGNHTKGVVGFEGLTVSCIIGTRSIERQIPQALIVDLKVSFDTSSEALSDDSAPRVDYTVLSDLVTQEAMNGRYQLMETLAARTLESVLARYQLSWAWIRLRKPGAIPGAAAAVLELECRNLEEFF